jgi:hypothetical protein
MAEGNHSFDGFGRLRMNNPGSEIPGGLQPPADSLFIFSGSDLPHRKAAGGKVLCADNNTATGRVSK